MNLLQSACLVALGLAVPVASASAQSLLSQAQVVLNEGDPVPGLPGHIIGISFGTASNTGGLSDTPIMDLNGNMLFRARISGPSQTNGDQRTDRVWLYGKTNDTLQLLLRSGDPDPTGTLGAGTVMYATIGTLFGTGLGGSPRISAEGNYLLLPMAMTGPSIISTGGAATTGRNDSVLLWGQPGALTKLIQRADPFPGGGGSLIDSGLNSISYQASGLNSSGVATFQVTLAGGDVVTTGAINSTAWLTGTPGNLSVVQRRGDTVVLGTGSHIIGTLGFNCPTNQIGQVLHDETLSTTLGTPPAAVNANSCVFIYSPGSGNALLVREGDVAPGCGGAVYGNATGSSGPGVVQGFGLAGAGWTSSLTGTGVTVGVNDQAIFVGSPAISFLVARKGDTHPSLAVGETINTINTSASYSDFEGGAVAFYASLTGASVTAFNDTSVWLGSPSNLRLLAREGDPAPGFSNLPGFVSAVFGNTATGASGIVAGSVFVNDRGQVHFNQTTVTVVDANGTTVRSCHYTWDPVVGLRLLLDGGQISPAVSGDTITGFYGTQPVFNMNTISNPNGDGGTMMLTADGDIAIRAGYTNGNGQGAILRAKLGSLDCGPSALSATLGGVQTMKLDGGLGNAGQLYAVVATASGTRPGFGFGPLNVPLNPDGLFTESLNSLSFGPGVPWGSTFGILDGSGKGTATFTMPPALPFFAGLEIDHAMVVLDPVLNPLLASAPCGVRLF